MQFAFTEEQELLRREARDALANGGWSRDEIGAADLGFVDKAVLFEEGGRAGVGESLFDEDRPEDERLATLALEAVGIAQKALELGDRVREGPGAVRPADRRLPGRLPPARRHLRRDRARPLARLLGRVVRRRGRRAGADRGRRPRSRTRRRGRRRVRALDPGARRHRLHLGARAARVLQAGAVDPGLRRLPREAARRDRRLSCSTDEAPSSSRARRRGSGRLRRRLARAAARCWPACGEAGDAPTGTEEICSTSPTRSRSRAAERVERAGRARQQRRHRRRCPLEFLPLDELRHQLEVNVVGQLAVTQAFLPALRARARPHRHHRARSPGGARCRSSAPYAMSKHALEAMADSLRSSSHPTASTSRSSSRERSQTPIWTKPQPSPTNCRREVERRALRRAHRGVSRRSREAWPKGGAGPS